MYKITYDNGSYLLSLGNGKLQSLEFHSYYSAYFKYSLSLKAPKSNRRRGNLLEEILYIKFMAGYCVLSPSLQY